ncbi:helix-turn-helix transcriptional regulator [Natronococcus wangiae]|uniref:helix-turn-helix transcriptional regulator n=1 Tax=Natronococcus wangiae TaxID=3068275 RepID=UPI00273F6418|nr:MarR family transcriptional regulator [Natronococcus sp. AD5]
MTTTVLEKGRRYLTREVADRVVLGIILGIALLGGFSTVRAYWQLRTTGGMMSEMLLGMPGANPVWNFFGTLVAISVVLGAYALGRDHLFPDSGGSTANAARETEPEAPPQTNANAESPGSGGENDLDAAPRPLTIFPDDERQVLEPIIKSPGLTQVELRGRSDFSKAKVSQTVSALEDRGLIYREKQGRTYRVYPGELLKEHVRT